ncbi:uncharacterized protein LOC129659356 [Bubalus kerabau]|uniref:protein transport protein SEC31-like n=1 Tax=Bubalus bubalis TaxID=89462 RepID=UPI000DBC6CFE|nr:protein transport protein SEC31-like [Bubalus bubalis]XP_045022355.1 protein transport protein SEC31-like [Bubalus bubalis]XP_055446574.1 uncharacterized protein LOC129659356 [Bubalus carabanensis]
MLHSAPPPSASRLPSCPRGPPRAAPPGAAGYAPEVAARARLRSRPPPLPVLRPVFGVFSSQALKNPRSGDTVISRLSWM